MATLDTLIEAVPPPESPISGDLKTARTVLGQHDIELPEDLWELLEIYGAGSFYEYPLVLLNPCTPDFAYRLASIEQSRRGCVTDGLFDSGVWVHLAEEREYVLFASLDGSVISKLAFVCVGSVDEYQLMEMSLSEFVLNYGTASIQRTVFGDQAWVSDRNPGFLSADNFWKPPYEWLEETANSIGMPQVLELYGQLRKCWPSTAR